MRKVLVILSGGMDSTICLAWARQNFEVVHAITFDYGQRHNVEIDAARKIVELLSVASHEIIQVGPILKSTSPLTSKAEVGHYDKPEDMPEGVEPTFVPARNLLFLTIALNRAVALDCSNIVMGVCEADYGGYPDCRQEFINHAARAMSTAIGNDAYHLKVFTPLMEMDKRRSVEFAQSLPGAMEALAYSHTSYDGDYPPNPFNHASMIRARGFFKAGVGDPLIERAIREGKLPADYPVDGYVVDTSYGDKATWASKVGKPETAEEVAADKGEVAVGESGEVVGKVMDEIEDIPDDEGVEGLKPRTHRK